MERLTTRDRQGHAYFDDDGILIRGANGTFHQKKDMTNQFIHQRFVALDKAIDRLAAYEDTGMEPQEVVAVLQESLHALNMELPPNNAPLTLEELREMDGEPVYLDFGDGGEWVLVRVQQGKVFVTHKNTICASANLLFECGGKAYRRKPEEV